MLRFTFNPGLGLTGFRTTRPGNLIYFLAKLAIRLRVTLALVTQYLSVKDTADNKSPKKWRKVNQLKTTIQHRKLPRGCLIDKS